MKVSELISLLYDVKNTKGDLEIRLCELIAEEEYTPLFACPKILSSKEFMDNDIELTFLDKKDICKDGREFLFFDCNGENINLKHN